ncbi:MAG TPA: NAD(P)H-hydrate dehydratase [Steroidobacteraceae bacterium]|jgi:NAD(P)H-hydrate epimerase|nr:NAD(P)H-hydrate dehydratase [Steroidobacteraceae bacterium]
MNRPTAIYSAAQVRALDAWEIEKRRVPGFTLMTRAAEGALKIIRARWPQAKRLAVVCGAGNNGGDGYVLARLARAAGLEALVLAAVPPDRLGGDARRAQEEWLAVGGSAHPFAADALSGSDLVVDALLGIGLAGAPRPETLVVIRAINAAKRPVLALDIPSGVNADSGAVYEAAVRAELTLSFVALKSGLFLGAGPEHAGVVLLDDLGVVAPAHPQFTPLMRRIDQGELAAGLPRRAREAHKGSNGRVLVIGGGAGMPGALRLAGEAALRAGAGLVTVAGAAENLVPVSATRPELIYLPVAYDTALDEAIAAADVLAIGPGLGTGTWAQRLWAAVRATSGTPAVVDADALNLLASSPAKLPPDWIITPHPGEAARLLGVDAGAVQADRLGAARELHSRYGAVTVLKGAGTLVASGPAGAVELAICERGNPGMATAGMGDVLTGVIAGLRAQCADSVLAARVGVLVHALAGDSAAQGGQRGLIASDVIAELRGWVNP